MKDFRERSVLVTGGAGFLGSHLVEKVLRRGANVTVADDLSTGHLENLGEVRSLVEFRQVDLARPDSARELLAHGRFDVVFHLAGHTDLPGSVDNPRHDLERNLLGTFNLLEAARSLEKKPAVLFASSAAVYGEGSETAFREDGPTFPVSPYGVSKLAAERYVAIYPSLYGVPTAILRLFPLYGPRLRALVVYDLMQKLRQNPAELTIQGNGDQVRDLSHAANAVDAFLVVAAQSPLEGDVYNVASGESVSIRELAQRISQEMGLGPRFGFTGHVRPGVCLRWTADMARLQSLGFQPGLSLSEGLRDTVAWFLRENPV